MTRCPPSVSHDEVGCQSVAKSWSAHLSSLVRVRCNFELDLSSIKSGLASRMLVGLRRIGDRSRVGLIPPECRLRSREKEVLKQCVDMVEGDS